MRNENQNPFFEEPLCVDGVRNPNKFTIDQHVFPRACIARFCNADSRVQTHIYSLSKVQPLSPKSAWFCAQRVWDQAAETRVAATERAYDRIASAIEGKTIAALTPEMDTIVTRFFFLWCARCEVRRNPPPPAGHPSLLSDTPLSKRTQEALETNGVGYAVGSKIPSRMFAGLKVRLSAMHAARHWQGTHWGILRSEDAEFLVPDNVGNSGFLPVSPKLCLAMGSDDCWLDPLQVGLVNRLLVESSERYYFARDLERSPIFRLTIPLDVVEQDPWPSWTSFPARASAAKL